jgi:ribonuclease HII
MLFGPERELHVRGFAVVAGVDEVGRGAIAGPVTAGAAVLAAGTLILGLDDSKRVPRPKRADLARTITERATAVSVGHTRASRIDEIGIVAATHEAMEEALAGLGLNVDHVLVDGKDAVLTLDYTPVIGGDATCAAIAAASVVAKVERDRLMEEYAERYPGYGFESHRGYCTDDHLEAVRRLGPSPIHRRSFEPCRDEPTLF